jgi:hypothetical protein
MTLDSAIKYKDFSNPSIVRVRPINIQMANDDYFSATGPAGATRLKLTKVLTVTDAQGQKRNWEVGELVWAQPVQNIGKSNSYFFTTEGKVYFLTVGVNAEIYNEIGGSAGTSGSAGSKGGSGMEGGQAETRVRLRLTKPLTVTNAQGQPYDLKVGAVIFAKPIPSIVKSNSYIFETEGKSYILTVGVNAELYNEALDNKKKKGGAIMLVGFALIAYVVYKIIGTK